MVGSKTTDVKGSKTGFKVSTSKKTSNPSVDETRIIRTRTDRVSKRTSFVKLAPSPLGSRSRSRSRRASAQASHQNSRTASRAASIDDASSEGVDDDMNVDELELELELEQTNQARIIRKRNAMLQDEARARAKLREVKRSINAMGVHDSRSLSHALTGDQNSAVATISSIASLPLSPFDDVRAFQGTVDSQYDSLARAYPRVNIQDMQTIYRSRLKVKAIRKFDLDYSTDINKEVPIQSMLQLLRNFEIYCQIVRAMAFAPRQQPLQQAMCDYRRRLMRMSSVYTFASINAFHEEFVARIIRTDQDDVALWRVENTNASYKLVHASAKKAPIGQPESNPSAYRSTSSFSKAPKPPKLHDEPYTPFNGACRNYNEGKACYDNSCKYTHVCLNCQKTEHGAHRCPKRRRWLQDFSFSLLSLISPHIPSDVPTSIVWVSKGLPNDVCPADEPDLDRPGPLLAEGWTFYLHGHPDKTYVRTLLGIIVRGAKVDYIGPQNLFQISKNHSSASEAPDVLAADVLKQLNAGRLNALPLPLPSNYICSPLGLVSKSDGGWRRIHDLSFPAGSFVNDEIPRDFGSLEYAAVDDAMAALILRGVGAVMLKEDLADAFRHVLVTMSDRWLLGFYWDDIFYTELFLPFGLRTASFLFDLFAKGVRYILAQVCRWRIVLHYLDDFFTILAPLTDSKSYKRTWRGLCERLDLRTNDKKETSDTLINFLSIEFDSMLMEARLPSSKHARAMKLVAAAVNAASLTHRELNTLVDFLSFCAKIVILDRTFLRSLYTSLHKHVQRHNIIVAMCEDLRWWHSFLSKWNDIKFLRDRRRRSQSFMWTDVSGNWGMSDHWHRSLNDEPHEVFSLLYSTRTRNKPKVDIQVKEMRTVLYGLNRWLEHIRFDRITIHCDNYPIVCDLRRGTMRRPAMAPLREIVMLLALNDVDIEQMIWIDSESNHLTDLLSRGRYAQIANEYPQFSNRTQWAWRHTTPPKCRIKTLQKADTKRCRWWDLQHVTYGGNWPPAPVAITPPPWRATRSIVPSTSLAIRRCRPLSSSWPTGSHVLAISELSLRPSRRICVAFARPALTEVGPTWPYSSDPVLQRIINGIKRERGDDVARERRPITRDILLRILPTLNQTTRKGATLHAAFTLTFVSFLRIGQFTYIASDLKSFDFDRWFVTRSSVVLYADRLELTLPASKTDPFRRGVTLTVAATNDAGCAISSMRNLFSRFPAAPNDPLFQVHGGTPFTAVGVTNVLRTSLRLLGYKGHYFDHSFRRGAATSTRLADVPDASIQLLDRWKSEAYLLYIDVDKESILRASRRHQGSWGSFCLPGGCAAVGDVVLWLEEFFGIAIPQLHRVLAVSEGIVVPAGPKHLVCFCI